QLLPDINMHLGRITTTILIKAYYLIGNGCLWMCQGIGYGIVVEPAGWCPQVGCSTLGQQLYGASGIDGGIITHHQLRLRMPCNSDGITAHTAAGVIYCG